MKWLIAFITAIVTSRRRQISSARCSGYLLLLQTNNQRYVLKGRAFYITYKTRKSLSYSHYLLSIICVSVSL